MHKLFLLCFFGLILSSCTKEERIIQTTHLEKEVILGNRPPEYKGITQVQIDAYLNKLFIDLYGREPLEAERTDGRNTLESGGLKSAIRESYIDDMLANKEYGDQQILAFQVAILGGDFTDDFQFFKALFIAERQKALQSNNAFLASLYEKEINRITQMDLAILQFTNGTGRVNEVLAGLVNNFLYDEINMGDENFSIACFENLLKRYPTSAELDKSVTMVGGFPARLLEYDGVNRDDFVWIMTNVAGFYEGLIHDLFLNYLARNPNSTESANHVNELISTDNFKESVRNILKTDEYAGF